MTTIHAEWAQTLTDERLAQDLGRLADDVRFCGSPEQRAALLREAARRLTPARRTFAGVELRAQSAR